MRVRNQRALEQRVRADNGVRAVCRDGAQLCVRVVLLNNQTG